MRACIGYILGLFILSHCAPTYAPPVRMTHFGTPGHVQGGKVELGGAYTAAYKSSGGPMLAAAFTDWLQLELGGEFCLMEDGWMMGLAGLRLTLAGLGSTSTGGTYTGGVDLELGKGIGKGGELRGDTAEGDRDADGWYMGIGAGMQGDWFSFFLRLRYQETSADDIPDTGWYTAVAGIGFTASDFLNFYLAGGGGSWHNPDDSASFWIFETGLSVEFDIYYQPPPPRKKTPWKYVKPSPRIERPVVRLTASPYMTCPPGAFIVGQEPPFGFEQYCAVDDPRLRFIRHGPYLGWYGKNRKASSGEYRDGRRHGKWTFWHANGRKRLEAHYLDGKKHGRWVFWDEDGIVTKEAEYRDDMEVER